MLKNIIVMSLFYTAVMTGQVTQTVPAPEYDVVAKVNEAVELSVEQKEGFKYEWNDGGAGKLEPAQGIKVRWTAPKEPGKENPAVITIIGRSESGTGTVLSTVIKKIAVLGGDMLSQPILFYCDGPGPARLFKSAPNQPKETRYEWEIVRGTENLSLLPEDINRSEAKFKARKPSAKKDDVEIKLTYTLGNGKDKVTYETSRKSYIMMPVALKQLPRQNKVEEGPDIYGYSTVTKYQVMDQLGEPLQAEGIVIAQDITLVSNPVGISAKAIKLDFNQYTTDYDGQIGSRRYINSVFPLAPYFSVVYEQDLFVNGSCLIEKLDITYTKNGVTEVSNKDRKTRRERLEKGKSKNDPNRVNTPR